MCSLRYNLSVVQRFPRRSMIIIGPFAIWALFANDILFKQERAVDEHALAILSWTGIGRALVLAFASLARFALSCQVFLFGTLLLHNLPKKTNFKYYTSWFFAVLVSTYMRSEKNSSVFIVYSLLSLAAFSGAHSRTEFIDDMMAGISGGALINVFRGLRMQSISPSKLVHFFGTFAVFLAILFGFYVGPNRTVARLSKRCCGLAVSLLVLYYATFMQNMTCAFTAILCIYGFVISCCIALKTGPSVSAIIFSLCGFLTIYSAMKLQTSFVAVSDGLGTFMPGFVEAGMVFMFGNGADRTPFELFVVESVVSYIRGKLAFG